MYLNIVHHNPDYREQNIGVECGCRYVRHLQCLCRTARIIVVMVRPDIVFRLSSSWPQTIRELYCYYIYLNELYCHLGKGEIRMVRNLGIHIFRIISHTCKQVRSPRFAACLANNSIHCKNRISINMDWIIPVFNTVWTMNIQTSVYFIINCTLYEPVEVIHKCLWYIKFCDLAR